MAFIYLALAMALVGANIAIGKAIVAVVPVFLFSGLRFLIASAVFLPVMLATRSMRVSRNVARGLFIQSLLGSFLFSVFMLYGLRYTSATSAGIITSATPAAIAALAWLFLRERMLPTTAAAIGLSIAGIAVLNVQAGNTTAAQQPLLGNLLVFAAVLCEASFAVMSRRLSASVEPVAMAAWVNVFGLVLFAPFAAVELASSSLGVIPRDIWALIVLYALTASVIAFWLWYKGIASVPANVAGVFTGVMPLTAALTAVIFLSEPFTAVHAIGMLLVLIAIVLGALRRR